MDLAQAQQMCEGWTAEMDAALVTFVNQLSHKLAVSPARLHAHDIYLTDAELSSTKFSVLQGQSTHRVDVIIREDISENAEMPL